MQNHYRPTVIRSMEWDPAHPSREVLLNREWLVTNGLGGYASGTVSGAVTRKYHGLLVAALPAPLGRVVMWNHVSEFLRFPGDDVVSLGAEERAGGQLNLHAAEFLREFRLEDGMPVWVYHVRDFVIEKRVSMPHLQNTVHVSYQINGTGQTPRLELRPAFHFRHHEEAVDLALAEPYRLTAIDHRYEIVSARRKYGPLRMRLCGHATAFTIAPAKIHQVVYRIEQARGYSYQGELWSPGFFQVDLANEGTATLIGSTEPWDIIDVLSPSEVLAAERQRRARLLEDAETEAQHGLAAELVFAGDQYVITPAGRAQEAARAHASGDEVRTIIAGYHWFTDWGRDTMISLEGLTLVTGRCLEAGYILRTFAHYVRDGLIPNMFPDRQKEGLYHTADATLWFFHALGRYLKKTEDRITLRLLLPTLVDIAEYHLRGTKFNIHVDPRDGLLAEGAEGYQLTWMDAKVGDWVVTPRRGKAVELNALWYNALCLAHSWTQQFGGGEGLDLAGHAARARDSFNRRFWYEKGAYLSDVVDGEDGDDRCCRPNQVFAISLPHPVLERDKWEPVMKVVRERLLTPLGLRSLAPGEKDYKPRYYGDLRARDAAYHQGTVWAWLIGPYIDAALKLPGTNRQALRDLLTAFNRHLDEACVGQISEVFDAESPFLPRGCVAQAWSVAEVLRSWLKL